MFLSIDNYVACNFPQQWVIGTNADDAHTHSAGTVVNK